MGHREDVWDNPDFQHSVVDAVHWVMGKGKTDAAPNVKDIMTPEDLAAVQVTKPAKP